MDWIPKGWMDVVTTNAPRGVFGRENPPPKRWRVDFKQYVLRGNPEVQITSVYNVSIYIYIYEASYNEIGLNYLSSSNMLMKNQVLNAFERIPHPPSTIGLSVSQAFWLYLINKYLGGGLWSTQAIEHQTIGIHYTLQLNHVVSLDQHKIWNSRYFWAKNYA